MDPGTMIVSALAMGAAAGVKPTVEQAVKDAYAGVKALLQRKYKQVSLSSLESKPESQSKRDSLVEDLRDAGAAADEELMTQSKILIDTIDRYAPSAAPALGIDLQRVKAAFLESGNVMSEGTGVRIQDGEFSGGIKVGEVQAGPSGRTRP